MSTQLGSIFCIDNKSEPYRYALVIGHEKDDYMLVNLPIAKPFERDSMTCLSGTSIQRINKKGKTISEKMDFRISGFPFRKSDLGIYGNPVGLIDKVKLQDILHIIGDKPVYKQEMMRLSSIKNELHNRLSELKKQREVLRITNTSYSEIQREMDEITMKLGYQQSNIQNRERFRVAPSKYIRIVPGGRGG